MANQHKEHNVEKYTFMGYTMPLTIQVYLHSFSSCCLPNLRNPAKFSKTFVLYQFKVIQGHSSCCQSTYAFFGCVSYCFWYIL